MRLLKDDGIVRHRGKIEAVINNAPRARELEPRRDDAALAAIQSRVDAYWSAVRA